MVLYFLSAEASSSHKSYMYIRNSYTQSTKPSLFEMGVAHGNLLYAWYIPLIHAKE